MEIYNMNLLTLNKTLLIPSPQILDSAAIRLSKDASQNRAEQQYAAESPPAASPCLVYSAGHTSAATEFRRPDSYADDCYTNINKAMAFMVQTDYLPATAP